MIDDFLELSKDEKLTMEARNEARLAVARLRYEKKDYEGALKAYDMVQLPSLDPGRATLYLEEAWTRYNLGQLRAAMGLLTTLDAPTLPGRVPPRQVHPARAGLPRPLPVPAGQARGEGAHPPVRRFARGHPRA